MWSRSAKVVAGTISPRRTCLVPVNPLRAAGAGYVRTEPCFLPLASSGLTGRHGQEKRFISLGGQRQQVTFGVGGTELLPFEPRARPDGLTLTPARVGSQG